MEDTIDLGPFISALVRYWWAILGAVIVAVVIAFYLYSGQTAYQATSWVAISEPSQRLIFDPRIENTQEVDLLLDSYPELALTDEVLSQLVPIASEQTAGEINTVAALRSLLRVERGDAPRLMHFSVKMEDPELAAEIANLWAEHFTKLVTDIYRNPGGQTEFFSEQLSIANAELQAAEDELTVFQARNPQDIVFNELTSLKEIQIGYLSERKDLTLLLGNIQALRSQLLSNNSPNVTYADQLTALTLQLNAYDTTSGLPTAQPQLQINAGGDLTTSDRAFQLQLLDNLQQAVEARLSATNTQLPELESQVLTLQSEYQALINEYDRLARRRDVAKETYLTLARKLDEVRIVSQDTGSTVQIASRATVPTQPDRSNPLLLFGAAAFLGALIAAACIVAVTWRRLRTASAS